MVEKEGQGIIGNIKNYGKLEYPVRYEKTLREELLTLYKLYKENAWGYQKIDAVTGNGAEGTALPLTMLESLVPLHYFGEWREIRRIQTYVEDNVDPTPDQMFATGEIVQLLAGMEYLQRLTGSREVYNKMVELGDSLHNNAFDGSTNMVYDEVNPATGSSPKDSSTVKNLAKGSNPSFFSAV